KCPDFQWALRSNLADLQYGSVQKSEHFLNAGWRCGWGLIRGGAPRSESELIACRWQAHII
ncbi:MAG: hypothetical protein IJF34_10845, partial [Clostridia bacterium]|nr:hypothetical protein [Clostridia bacterium]